MLVVLLYMYFNQMACVLKGNNGWLSSPGVASVPTIPLFVWLRSQYLTIVSPELWVLNTSLYVSVMKILK